MVNPPSGAARARNIEQKNARPWRNAAVLHERADGQTALSRVHRDETITASFGIEHQPVSRTDWPVSIQAVEPFPIRLEADRTRPGGNRAGRSCLPLVGLK